MSADELDRWEESYRRFENHLYWPSDEGVRFVARYLRRRRGLDEFIDVAPNAKGSRMLDLGCGVGRMLAFGTEMGFEMYGIDLSTVAIDAARKWIKRIAPDASADGRIVAGDVRKLPWADAFFDHAMSESALDSMPFATAATGVAEVSRVLKPGGYFYCSLISSDQTGYAPDFSGEIIVETQHEQGTIQTFFNRSKIDALFGGQFDIVQCLLHRIEDRLRGTHHSRWFVVGRKR